DPELNESIRGPLGRERNGDPLPDMLIGGRALIGRFLIAMRKYPNVQLYRNTPLEELIVEDGVLVGAIVENNGERRTIRARKGVVLAAGGFDQNDEMRSKYGVP